MIRKAIADYANDAGLPRAKGEEAMRLDKYLKVSRIIKRRSVANEAAGMGRIAINGKTAKPASDVKAGDVLDILLGGKHVFVRVEKTPEFARKEDADSLYTVLDGEG
jgi:ribosomal 50S subunit-recycling heat shock protein